MSVLPPGALVCSRGVLNAWSTAPGGGTAAGWACAVLRAASGTAVLLKGRSAGLGLAAWPPCFSWLNFSLRLTCRRLERADRTGKARVCSALLSSSGKGAVEVSRRLLLLTHKNAFHKNLTEIQRGVGFSSLVLALRVKSTRFPWGGTGSETRCCVQAAFSLWESLLALSCSATVLCAELGRARAAFTTGAGGSPAPRTAW